MRTAKSNGGSLETTFEEAKAADAVLVIEGIRPESFLDESDVGLDSAFQQLAFHIERFSGVVLLLVTSDDVFRMQLLPQEFARLTKFLVLFDHPTADQRQALWRSALPSRVPLAEDVDFAVLGAYDLDAGGIASAAFRACAKAVLRTDMAKVFLEDLTSAAEVEKSLLNKSKGVSACRPSIEEFLRKHRYQEISSFHTIYMLTEERSGRRSWKGCERLCWRLKSSDLERLFIPILTLDGVEGSYPEMFDQHPKNMGLCFQMASNGYDVLLLEAQDRLSSNDLEGSMYFSGTGGMRPGHVAKLEPVACNGTQELLVDLTDWMKRFSEYFKGDGQQTQILEAKGYKDNFLIRCSTQQQSKLPVKSAKDSLTVYFTVAFASLPAEAMTPRASDARVGFFTTPILVGGPTQATTVQYVISKWNLERRKQLQYVIDKSVPEIYHETIKKGVLAWNETLCGATDRSDPLPLVLCVAPGDDEYPEEYEAGDGRHIAIFMTNPSTKGLLGYGPSAVDYRSGEILTASVVLALKSHVTIPSDYSEPLLKQKDGGRWCQRLLDADDPDVLKCLLETTVHEVGHTLGLRHNFIAAEDGRSSVMDYPDDLDTTDPEAPVFGGHFLGSPGRYDDYAIKYGYTPLEGETRGQRHPKLELLANGQSASDQQLLEPRNPLFASDDDVGGLDPRVQKGAADIKRMGVDKILWSRLRRKTLLEHVQEGLIDCNLYSQRVLATLEITSQAVLCASGLLGGRQVDASRSRAQPVEFKVALQYVAVALHLLGGPVFRLLDAEKEHLLKRRDGEYGLTATSALTMHAEVCDQILGRLLDPSMLEQLESQTSEQRSQPEAFQLMKALAFGTEPLGPAKELEGTPLGGLLYPLRPDLRMAGMQI